MLNIYSIIQQTKEINQIILEVFTNISWDFRCCIKSSMSATVSLILLAALPVNGSMGLL